MTEQPQGDRNTELDDLNEDGVGGTVGADSTFEPEEDEKNAADTES